MQEIFLKKKSSILSFSPSHQLEYWVMSWEPPAKDGKTVMEGPDSWCRALDCSHISELNQNLTDTSKVSFVKSICFLLQDILADFKVTVIFAYTFLLIVFVALLFHTVLNPSGHILICFRRLPSFSLHYEPILPPPLIKQFSSLSCDIISTVYQDRIFSVQWYALSLVLSSTLNNSGIGKYTWHTCGIQKYMCGFHVKRILGLFFFFFFLNIVSAGSVVKNLPSNVGDVDSIPGLGRSPWEGNGNPLQYSCLEYPKTEEPGGLQPMGSQQSDIT